jgi:glycosyltransferase involved in cell wall biosynthesis
LICLRGIGYRKNVSFARLWNHRQLGHAFSVEAARRSAPDVIICSFPLIDLAYAAANFADAQRVPLVLDVRDLWPDIFVDLVPAMLRSAARIALRPWFRMTREAFVRATAIVAVSDGYLSWALAYAGRGRRNTDRVFPLAYEEQGADGSPDVAANVRAHGVDVTRKIALFVGTFGRTYDLSTVIEAARMLASDDNEDAYLFVLCGSGDKASQWRSEARGLRNVVFTGWLDAPAISFLLKHAHVGLAAYEAGAPQGLPNKFFEYMATGLPVLSSLKGEAEAFLEEHDCGLSYPPRDAAALVRCLQRIADDDAHARLSKNSGTAFAEEYSAEKVYRAYTELVETLADSERCSERRQL